MTTADSEINKAVAAQLRARMGLLGMTQKDLINESGLSTSTVSRILSSKTDISLTNLTVLARAMGTHADAILDDAFEHVGYDRAYEDAVIRVTGRKMSDVSENITSLDQHREARMLDEALQDGTEQIAADVNEEADHDEPEAP